MGSQKCWVSLQSCEMIYIKGRPTAHCCYENSIFLAIITTGKKKAKVHPNLPKAHSSKLHSQIRRLQWVVGHFLIHIQVSLSYISPQQHAVHLSITWKAKFNSKMSSVNIQHSFFSRKISMLKWQVDSCHCPSRPVIVLSTSLYWCKCFRFLLQNEAPCDQTHT